MQNRNVDKDLQIFNLLNQFEVQLQQDVLNKKIAILQSVLKLFSASDNLRREFKKAVNGLISIRNAFNRVDHQILLQDLDQINQAVQDGFEMFKINSGIHDAVQPEKKKHVVIKSLQDLDLLGKIQQPEKQSKAINPLKFLLQECLKKFEGAPQYVHLNIPLIVSAHVQNEKILPKAGIVIQSSSFGYLWSNQYVIALHKDFRNWNLQDLYRMMENKYHEKFELKYKPIRHKAFADYTFYWMLPARVSKYLQGMIVYNCSLPFEQPLSEQKAADKQLTEKLRQLRLQKESQQAGEKDNE